MVSIRKRRPYGMLTLTFEKQNLRLGNKFGVVTIAFQHDQWCNQYLLLEDVKLRSSEVLVGVTRYIIVTAIQHSDSYFDQRFHGELDNYTNCPEAKPAKTIVDLA